MKKQKRQTVSTTVSEVEHGVDLCRENARRLMHNARILLENGGSDGLAYVLWSLAVEEFGKGLLLKRQAPTIQQGVFEVKISKDHDEKFVAGLAAIRKLQNTHFRRLLRIKENRRNRATTVEDPLRPGSSVSVAPSTSGLFSDGLDAQSGVDATVALRFDILYVDWQKRGARFVRPGETIRLPEVTGRWELKREDLELAIDALDKELKNNRT